VRSLDVERVEQPGRVIGHVVQRVAGARVVPRHQLERIRHRPVLDLRREADVAVVEPHDVEAAAGEQLAEALVPAQHLNPEPHDQQHRGVRWVAEGLVFQLDAVGLRAGHPVREAYRVGPRYHCRGEHFSSSARQRRRYQSHRRRYQG
jgi:hypothetical protein